MSFMCRFYVCICLFRTHTKERRRYKALLKKAIRGFGTSFSYVSWRVVRNSSSRLSESRLGEKAQICLPRSLRPQSMPLGPRHPRPALCQGARAGAERERPLQRQLFGSDSFSDLRSTRRSPLRRASNGTGSVGRCWRPLSLQRSSTPVGRFLRQRVYKLFRQAVYAAQAREGKGGNDGQRVAMEVWLCQERLRVHAAPRPSTEP